MNDRISHFRFIRLTIHPSEIHDQAAYTVLAGVVRQGIPRADIVCDGQVYLPAGPLNLTLIREALREAGGDALRRLG